jgi:transcriptional regulator with XRE-family HTH domain
MSKRSVRNRMLANPDVRREYEALAPEFEVARELIAARVRAELSQAELAQRMGTTQSAVARMESGRRLPSMTTLARYAKATGARAQVRIVPLEKPRRRTAH